MPEPLHPEPLNPAQRAVLDALGAGRGERPEFDPALGADLRASLTEAFAPMVATLDELDIDQLWVSKHSVASALSCEVRFLDELERGFDGWTIPRARGTVAHRAIETSLHVRGEPVPGELVDHAIARLAEGESGGLSDWLRRLTDLEVADLKGAAVEHVAAFLESWPRLKPQWRPRSESKLRLELCDQRVVLSGKVDLTVGMAEGSRAGKVLIDFKTGGFVATHLDDLRFYALLETAKIGVPPRRVASHYLDSGRLVPEDVTVPLLESAARRVVDSVERSLVLRSGDRPPTTAPGPACRWCPVRPTCEPGTAYVDAATDRD